MKRTVRAVIPSTRYRRSLARVAVAAVDAGWPVVPGAWWSATAGQFVCDVSGCPVSGPHPVLLPGPGAAGREDPDEPGGLVVDALTSRRAVVERWRRQPYGVLVPTGVACDALEVPAALGRWLAGALESQGRLGPVLETGHRWTVFTTPAVGGGAPGTPGGPGVQGPGVGSYPASGILRHGLGSWVALPPSRRPGGEASTWVRHPQASAWALPDHHEVDRLLTAALGRRRVLVPAPGRRRHRPGVTGDDLVALMS